MKLTNDKIFADSNILLYLLSDNITKKEVAKEILKAYPIISTQVVSENINVLFKKFSKLSLAQIEQHKNLIITYCKVVPVNIPTIEKTFELKKRYQFNWYDCTIIASALLEECNILYSEDLQHLQFIEKQLKIINPFV